MLNFPDPHEVERRLRRAYPHHDWDVYAKPIEPDEAGLERMVYVSHCNTARQTRFEIETIVSESSKRSKYGGDGIEFATDALVTHLLHMRTKAIQAITGMEARSN